MRYWKMMDQNPSAADDTCIIHQSKQLKGYCYACDAAVCSTCLEERCQRHRIDDDLSGISSEQIDRLKKQLHNFKTHKLPLLNLKIQTLLQEGKERNDKKDEMKKDILSTAKQLKEEMMKRIDSAVTTLLTEIDNTHVEPESLTSNLATEILDFSATATDKVEKWEAALNKNPQPQHLLQYLQLPILIKETQKEIDKSDAHISSSSSAIHLDQNIQDIIFSELKNWIENFANTNSEIENTSDAVKVLEKATLVQEIHFNSSIIQSICSSRQEKTWIQEGKQLHLLGPAGQCLQTYPTENTIGSIASDRNGDILATVPQKRIVLKITTTHKSTEIMFIENINDLIPCGIGIQHNTNEILLGLVDELDFYPTASSQRLIRIYDSNGKVKGEYLGCYGDRKIFIQPQRIAVSKNSNHVAVVNRTKQLNGEIIILKKGKIISFFPEIEDTRKHWFRKSFREKFDPRDIDFDVLNNIVICDYESKSLFLIHANSGQLLQQYDCPTWPHCISCMSDQKLWVGCAGESIKVFKYLSYD